jgi:hypothetical protein
MKRFYAILGLAMLLVAGVVVGQLQILQSMPATLTTVTGTSTVVVHPINTQNCAPNCGQHYLAIGNQGPGIIVMAYSSTITQSVVNLNGGTVTLYVGEVIYPNVIWEMPANKEYLGPISAVCTNGTSVVCSVQGFLPNP